MISILHVLSSDLDPADAATLRTLVDRLPADEFRHAFATLRGRAAGTFSATLARSVSAVPARLGLPMTPAPSLAKLLVLNGSVLLHAWGLEALAATVSLAKRIPLIASALRPEQTARAARWMRQAPTAVVVTSGQLPRRAMVEHGVALQQTAVIRPPIDLAAINAARRDNARLALVGEAGPVILVSGPPRRDDGQFEALWAAAILQYVHADIRIIVPFASTETGRIRRLTESLHRPAMLVVPDMPVDWPQLVAAADFFVTAPVGEISTEPLAWAMAGGLSIVASARRSISELVADHSNGLLVRDPRPRDLAAAILRLLDDEPLRRRLADTARGQAYEVFGVRDSMDNHARLYRCVVAGQPPGGDIRDTAMT